MKILVTGATSFIGLEVISQLLKKGHEVRTLTRQENTPAILKNTETQNYIVQIITQCFIGLMLAMVKILAK